MLDKTITWYALFAMSFQVIFIKFGFLTKSILSEWKFLDKNILQPQAKFPSKTNHEEAFVSRKKLKQTSVGSQTVPIPRPAGGCFADFRL